MKRNGLIRGGATRPTTKPGNPIPLERVGLSALSPSETVLSGQLIDQLKFIRIQSI